LERRRKGEGPVSLLVVGIVVGLAAFSGFALKALPAPFAWIALTWGVVFVATSLRAHRWARVPVSTLGAAAIALGLAEAWFAQSLPREVEHRTSPPISRHDTVLGWALRPSQAVHATASVEGASIYSVTYTIDSSGHRVVPEPLKSSPDGCVLFFTDSFVFGEGVEDADAIPYRFALLSDRRYRVVNYAAPAYGAEHMLATLERGELAEKPPCEPTHVVYVALPHHVLRAAGKTSYSGAGPRYRLGPRGEAEFVGVASAATAPASTSQSWWRRELEYQATKSNVRRMFVSRTAAPTTADEDLYFAIVRQAFGLMRDRWPSAQRHVVSWDLHAQFANGLEKFHRGLRTIDARIHPIDAIAPFYTADPMPFSIHALDQHPNARMDDLVARYFVGIVSSSSAAAKTP